MRARDRTSKAEGDAATEDDGAALVEADASPEESDAAPEDESAVLLEADTSPADGDAAPGTEYLVNPARPSSFTNCRQA
jgi:hypothetical protein